MTKKRTVKKMEDCYYDKSLFYSNGISILEDLLINIADVMAIIYLELISFDSNVSNEMNNLCMTLRNEEISIGMIFGTFLQTPILIYIRLTGTKRIRVPYPFQWGAPAFDTGEAFAMMMATFVVLLEICTPTSVMPRNGYTV